MTDTPIIDDQLLALLSPYQASDWSLSLDQTSDWLIHISADSSCQVKSDHLMLQFYNSVCCLLVISAKYTFDS